MNISDIGQIFSTQSKGTSGAPYRCRDQAITATAV